MLTNSQHFRLGGNQRNSTVSRAEGTAGSRPAGCCLPWVIRPLAESLILSPSGDESLSSAPKR